MGRLMDDQGGHALLVYCTVWPVPNICQSGFLPEPMRFHLSGQAIEFKLVGDMPMFYQTPSDTIDTRNTKEARANFEPQHGVRPLIGAC
jgi:hypothetical protein